VEIFTVQLKIEHRGDVQSKRLLPLGAKLAADAPNGVEVLGDLENEVPDEIQVGMPDIDSPRRRDVQAMQEQLARVQRLVSEACAEGQLEFGWFDVLPPPEWHGGGWPASSAAG
jgi:hypothetical protein